MNNYEQIQDGEGYTDTDFPLTVTIYNPESQGRDATITFPNGIVSRILKYDRAPRLVYGGHNGKILHPTTQREGMEKSSGSARTEIPIPDNSLYHKYPGEYECFYYFHNDISHNVTETLMQNGGISISDFVQNITIKIS